MRKPNLILVGLVSSLFFAAPAGAVDYGSVAQLSSQVRGLQDQQYTAQDELLNRQNSRARLSQQAGLASLRVPTLNSKVHALSVKVNQTRDRLNKATEQYINLIRQLGQDPNSPAQETEQQLIQYLSTSRMHDAALVFQLSSAIINQQEGILATLRQSAQSVQDQESKLQQAQGQLKTQAWLANQAVGQNEQRITELNLDISGRQQQIDSLQRQLSQKLAVDQARAGGGILTLGQVQFSYQLAALSGLDVNVIKAWCLAEESDGYARSREKEHNNNWLNIGYYDSLHGGGAFQAIKKLWQDPISAANTSEAFLEGRIFGASSGIQDILMYAGASADSQIAAIASSGWASSAYGGGSSIHGTYNRVPHSAQPPRTQVRWYNPRNHKTYLLGAKQGL
jgi:hypothetical protein